MLRNYLSSKFSYSKILIPSLLLRVRGLVGRSLTVNLPAEVVLIVLSELKAAQCCTDVHISLLHEIVGAAVS